MSVDVVVGLQYGDEGKGKIVDTLASDYDIVVRFNGGNNAGHTIKLDGIDIALHLVPSGIIQRKISVIGNGANVNIQALTLELKEIKQKFGFDPLPYLILSDRSHVILPEDIESSRTDLNSTGRGIGPSYERKHGRRGITIGDLFDIRNGSVDKRFSINGLEELVELISPFMNNVKDVSSYLHNAIKSGKNILLEGAQGSGLDIDHGQYPFVTSSSCVAGGACIGAGLGPTEIDEVIGVAKVYTTRVDGNKESPFPTLLDKSIENFLRECGNEYGSSTGRPRRCGWFDLVQVNQAIQVSGVEEVVLTKLDVLDNLSEIKVCTSYNIDGRIVESYPATSHRLRNAIPVYETLEGWKGESSKNVTNFSELPINAQNYVKYLQNKLNARISLISTGTSRDDLIEL